MDDATPWRDWSDLSEAEQLVLREAFGHYQDAQPRTCDLMAKIERFRGWLAARRVRYPSSDEQSG